MPRNAKKRQEDRNQPGDTLEATQTQSFYCIALALTILRLGSRGSLSRNKYHMRYSSMSFRALTFF